jgi:transcriptional regulator with XRE-family HTH domain
MSRGAASDAGSIGTLLRSWRAQRRLSQLDLAGEAGISQKHLSFVESGRSAPSRDMVLRLAEHLDLPLRERNALLVAAGFAPVFGDRPLTDPALGRALAAVERLLAAHEPNPALVLDRHWNIVAANAAVPLLIGSVDPELLTPPVNALRLSLHPRGLAPSIVNRAAWRRHLIDRVRRQCRLTRDPALEALLGELLAYPDAAPPAPERLPDDPADDIAVPLRLRTPQGVLSFLSTVTVFGTAVEIVLSELTLEAFYPADAHTADVLRSALMQDTAEADAAG